MTVRAGAGNHKGVRQRTACGRQTALQCHTQGFDLRRGQVGEVGDGSGLDLAVEAERLAQEDSGGEPRLGTEATYMLT
jgi:hypothetical protein